MRARLILLAAAGAVVLTGCGSGGASSSSSPAPHSTSTLTGSSAPARAKPPAPLRLAGAPGPALPSARSGIATVAIGGDVLIAGGLSDGAVSTDTVFRLTASGTVTGAGTLPSPAHDAAAAALGGRVLLFGGGQSEGSDRIEQIIPAPARVIGHLPQALSDLTATTIGDSIYVAGGWNGTDTNRGIFALKAGSSTAVPAGQLPQGVRYPAVAALGGRLIVAGGELASGSPTASVWSFDPATGAVSPLPALPAPIDHSSAAVLNGRFYLLGGLRQGTLSATILSWAPGERAWRVAGRLPVPLQNGGAAPYRAGIALIGGKTAAGTTAVTTLLAPTG